ncbi:MAG: hypothetical protein JW807_06050 [Spirochaetes bacterium]|nr:hypothetical protein [Spirochaetota bacterium]
MYREIFGFTICTDAFPSICDINIQDGLIQIIPIFDVIIEIKATIVLILAVAFLFYVVMQFVNGLRGL